MIRVCLALLVLVGAAWSPQAPPPEASDRELGIKANFIWKLARYITWPDGVFADDNAPWVLGVLGEDPFGQKLDDLVRGVTVHGRSFRVRRFAVEDEEWPKRDALRGCHILFVAKSERERLARHLATLDRATVLTVSDLEGFARRGGAVELAVIDGKVRLKINRRAAEHDARLDIKPALLRVAIIVEPDPPPKPAAP